MEKKVNYQKEMERVIEKLAGERKTLFLHSCCAPCSSYCLEYLREYFAVTVFYYNPNISGAEEYRKRVEEQKRLIQVYNEQIKSGDFDSMHSTKAASAISIVEGDYEPECFFSMAKGLEACKEGGERCFRCYEMRLLKTAELAKEKGFDYFATTLTISPLKNAQKLNEIGIRIGDETGILFLPSDFKKKEGYKRSIALSEVYHLYRQDFCGCAYSKAESERRKAEKSVQNNKNE